MRPATDILIAFHSRYEYVVRCVEGVIKCTPKQPYTICLVDDASPNKSFLQTVAKDKITDKVNRNKIIGKRLEEQTGFGGALFEAYKLTKNPWIVLMHSDCAPTNIHWLIGLQRTMMNLKENGVKLVSARTNRLGDNAASNELLLSEPNNIVPDLVSEQALPLFCCLVHRDLFKLIGGFVKSYPYTGYEEEELFWRMKKHGYKQVICGSSYVHHEGSATIKNLIAAKPTIKQEIENNRDRCIADIKELGITLD